MAAIVASKVRKQRAAQQLAKDTEPTPLQEEDKTKKQSSKVNYYLIIKRFSFGLELQLP